MIKAMNMLPSENARDSSVSTTLSLSINTSSSENPKKRNRDINDPESNNNLKKAKPNLAWMRNLSPEEKAEEERRGYSTELTLWTDPWIIKKKLTTSDISPNSRLLLVKNHPIQDHILQYLSEEDQNKVEVGEGVRVNVYDHDTRTKHEVVLKRWSNWESYILNGGWRKDFVRRRDLRKGDEIGMFWDRARVAPKLHFRVLSRAAPI